MKALILNEFNTPYQLQDREKPTAGRGEVLVKIMASGVNPLDLKIIAGQAAHAQPKLPAIIGIDMAGTVEVVGEGVSGFKPGDEVYGMTGGIAGIQGSLAEYAAVDADLLALKPRNLSMQEAAALPLIFITAWEGLVDRAKVNVGKTVLIHGGAGGVGHVGIQLAKAFGAEVFATGSPADHDLIRSYGATAIDYKSTTVEEYVEEYTQGEGFDIILDTVGGAVLDASFKAVKRYSGHVVSILGWGSHALAPLSFRGATYSGVFTLYPLISGEYRRHHGDILRSATALAESGKLMPVMDKTSYTLDTVSAAYDAIAAGRTKGKVVISLLIIFLLVSMGVSAQQAIVTGTLPEAYFGKSIKLTLIDYETRNDKVVQEGTITPDGKFTLTIALREPEIYDLGVDNSSLVQVLAKPGDKIDLTIGKDSIQVTGSVETQYLIDYEANRKKVFNKYLKRTYDSSAVAVKSGDKEKIEYWNVEHEKASQNYKAELAQWVEQPFFINSLAAIHHSIRWDSDKDTALMNQMVSIFQQKYPHDDLTRQLVNKVNATKRIAIGAIAPGFVTTDTAGKKIDLKGYRGKYTLVEFWASWCAPCREESPTLVRLYNEYKDKGFSILSVSIDKNTTQWKGAIRQDGYTWGNVCDLNGYGGPVAALYTVTAIPNSFLLDKNGRIIAKNLRGKLLESKLAELMH